MTFAEWLDTVVAVARREVAYMAAAPQLLLFCFVLPVFWLLVIWGLLGEGVIQHAPVALVDQDHSSQSRQMIRALAACRAARFETFAEPDSALAAMRAGQVYGVVLLPAGYGREEVGGNGGIIVLWLDENRYAAAGVLKSEFAAAIEAASQASLRHSALRLGADPAQAGRMVSVVHDDFYALGNDQFSFLLFLGSTLIPSVIMIGAMFTFVTAFLHELWHGTVGKWIDCAHGRSGCAILGKLLPYYAVYSLVFLFYLALFTGQGQNFASGSLLVWLLLGMACLAAFAAAAIVVAAIAPTWRMAMVISAGYAAPALPFSGFSMPLDSMGHAVAVFSRCLPLTWFVQGQSQQWTLGANLAQMSSSFAALGCIFVVALALGLPLLRWSYGRHARKEAAA